MSFGTVFWWGIWPLAVAGAVLLADRYWQPHDRTRTRPGE